MDEFDVIVIGGGHAGVEAASAVSRSGARCALVTLRADRIGAMSCNPAIGGIAKGQMAREVDALGGLMGRAIDATGVQFRMLNRSKGPAVQSPRAQADRHAYAEWMRAAMHADPNITVIEGEVVEVLAEMGNADGGMRNAELKNSEFHIPNSTFRSTRVTGVELGDGRVLRCRAVVVTTGTFLNGLMHTGERQTAGGRAGEPASAGLTASLRRLGIEFGRLKTGTCPRLAADSIDFAALEVQPGDADPQPFSFLTDRLEVDQLSCWITWTHEPVHRLIRANLHRAPMFSGQITARGPRYCPSIEDKIVRFAEKDRHQVFLEPEGRDTDWVYCNGIATSLPADVQARLVHMLAGLGRARIVRFGYAVEYDFAPPTQLDATLACKRVGGLFLAGQINGTSGYEEAAGQGIVAGINAARCAAGLEPVVIGRDQAYIGVMIDDLVTKGADEPYRMFTSRAEHRLLLRSDNADRRLTPLAARLGLAEPERAARLEAKERAIAALTAWLEAVRSDGRTGLDLLRRPGVALADLFERFAEPGGGRFGAEAARQVEIEAKYSGYIAMARRQVERFRRMEDRPIPADLDWSAVSHLRHEAREKFARLTPRSLGQAGRISGISPNDLAVLLIHLEQRRGGAVPTRRDRASRAGGRPPADSLERH